jgi:hypothetical protein
VVTQVVTVEVLYQSWPILSLPEQHGSVKLVDQWIIRVFAQVSAVNTVSKDSQAGVSTVHHEQATTRGHLHRILGLAAQLNH